MEEKRENDEKIIDEVNKIIQNGWIDTFYSRIMNQTDPLAMYRKATAPRPAAKPVQRNQTVQPQYTYPAQHYQPKKTSNKSIGWIVFIIIAVIIGFVFALKYFLT